MLYCLAAGLLAAMLEVERSRFAAEREYSRVTATSYGIAEARQEDLGTKLADGRTRMLHLAAPNSRSIVGALALNEPLHWGALFCDQLPPLESRRQYEIWSIAPGGAATRLAGIQAAPGVSIYPFQWTDDAPASQRIEITDGNRASGAAVIFAGSLQ